MFRLVCMKSFNNIVVSFLKMAIPPQHVLTYFKIKIHNIQNNGFVVLREFVIQLAMYGMNNMKVIWYKSRNM